MTLREDIRKISADMDTPALLRFLIEERFAGVTVVTASLRAPSIVVLKMVSDIDTSTPVVFCRRPPVFEASTEYRAQIVSHLGLQNVSVTDGRETEVAPGDKDHTERLWVQYKDMPGRSAQLLHLNESLRPYKCWINAVYHVPRDYLGKDRVEVDGRLIRVNPLARWTRDDVRAFMRTSNLPYHKMAKREFQYQVNESGATVPTYHF